MDTWVVEHLFDRKGSQVHNTPRLVAWTEPQLWRLQGLSSSIGAIKRVVRIYTWRLKVEAANQAQMLQRIITTYRRIFQGPDAPKIGIRP